MKLQWTISKRDVRTIQELVRANRRNPFVARRIERNVRGRRPNLTPTRCWHTLMLCLLTTQQRSGPDSPVQKVLTQNPFPLRLGMVRRERSPSRFIRASLRRAGGIRRVETIGREAAANLVWFLGPRWRELRTTLESDLPSRGFAPERKVARWIAQEFKGLGPKQSRNFLQCLGLTRYEIPVDSRITSWLNDFGFPVTLNAKTLSDPEYYAFVNDGIRALCKAAGVYPCVLDAVVFSLKDENGWDDRKIVF